MPGKKKITDLYLFPLLRLHDILLQDGNSFTFKSVVVCCVVLLEEYGFLFTAVMLNA
jgi:hypothetical protein